MKFNYYKNLLVVLAVSFSVILGSLTPLSSNLKANEDGPKPISKEYIDSLMALDKKFENPSGKSHPLDVFKLLDQTVHNSDQEKIDAKVAEVLAEDGSDEAVDDFVDRSIRKKQYFRKNLRVEVRPDEDYERSIQTLKEGDFLHTEINEQDRTSRVYKNATEYIFSITDKKGDVLHTFHRPLKSVTFYGPYLVYVNQDSYDAKTGQLNLNFINLDYFRGDIGNSALPVFTFPIKTGKDLESLAIEKGVLKVNDLPLEKRSFDFLAQLYQVQYNISVSMVDPETYSRSENLIKEIVYYFNQAMKGQDESIKLNLEQALGNEQELQKILQGTIDNLKDHSEAVNEYPAEEDLNKVATDSLEGRQKKALDSAKRFHLLNKNLAQTNENIQSSRKFLARVNMWISNLTTPQPLGAKKLIVAMASLATSVFKDKEARTNALKDIRSHRLYKYLKFGGAALAAAAIGPHLPEPYAFHMHQSLDLVQTIFTDFKGYLQSTDYGLAYFKLLGEAMSTAANGIPNIPNAYLTAERLPKFIVGVSSIITIPFMVFGVPHTLVNSFKALKSVKNNWKELREQGLGRIATFRQAFIDHVQKERSDYDKIMAEAEQKISGGNTDLSDEELQELERHLNKLKSADNPEKVSVSKKALKLAGKVLKSPFVFVQWTRRKTAGAFQKSGDFLYERTNYFKGTGHLLKKVGQIIDVGTGGTDKKIETFGRAFQNFFFSYPALTNTYRFLATTWNYFFLARSFALRPKTWVMGLVYPRYFRVTIEGKNGRINFPSQFNGGTRTFFSHWSMRGRELFGNKELLALREWEKSILPIESIVYELSLQKSLDALIQEIDDPEHLKRFFDSGNPVANGKPSTGIGSLGDIKVSQLGGKEKAFFRAYFTKTYDETMKAHLVKLNKEMLDKHEVIVPPNIEEMSVNDLKRLSLTWIDDLKELDKQIDESGQIRKKITAEVKVSMEEVIGEKGIVDWARKVATDMGMLFKRKELNFRHNLFKTIRPQNPQINRFLTAEKQIAKPKALARAVRSEVASLLVSKPLALVGILALYAGVEEGILRPLHDTMNGPDSWLYMSRYLFYNGFVMGTIISIMADTWMKVQMDARIDEMGNFDTVPLKKYREKGFWRYYFKSFMNPANKLSSNQFHMTKLIWANIPAAFITISVTNFLMLGRFDIGAFVAGYFIVFMTPLYGLNMKFEQAFELASSWVASKIPKKFRSHPDAQSWINMQIQKKKLQFNFFYQTWEIVIGNIVGIFELMSTDQYGKRSFLRLIFNGYTPTELAAMGLRKIGDVFGFIPGVELITTKCEDLLTNNYTDWQKVSPRGK